MTTQLRFYRLPAELIIAVPVELDMDPRQAGAIVMSNIVEDVAPVVSGKWTGGPVEVPEVEVMALFAEAIDPATEHRYNVV